eukprot:m.73463 g.73463  ORF g.73463 m.73463 type:complete len:182 (-) comp8839_c0_seq2:771-1316(-)
MDAGRRPSGRTSPTSWSMSDDVLADRFPVSSAAVPLSDSLRRISAIFKSFGSEASNTHTSSWTPASSVPRWLQEGGDSGGMSAGNEATLTPMSSTDSLDRVGISATPAGPAKCAPHTNLRPERIISPSRVFTALDLSNTLVAERRVPYDAMPVSDPVPIPLSNRASVSSTSTSSSYTGTSL